jgi:peptidoglycan/LPS O-acetylase OafA/YrhL
MTNWQEVYGAYFGVFTHLWSLAVEEQFYLVFPFVIYFLPKKTVIGIALVAIVLAAFIRAYLWKVGGFYTGYFPTPARADGLMFGVLVAYAIRNDGTLTFFKRHRIATDMIALAGAVILTWCVDWMPLTASFTLRSALFAYVIGRIFFSEGKMRAFLRSNIMVALGAISYPFYMYHQAINGMFHGLFLGQVPRIANWQGVLVAIAVLSTAAILATFSTLYFEKPFRMMGKRAKYQQAISTIPAVA